ncbi:MAG: hypothetical protein HON53_23475 [Planctomycetaceae bacterium]|jgi:Ca2+-binding EF-hand superfamily protein|nr:hypothetical protein [Planctomycetaceae bacterium]MBT6156943.1 hypothetical protein [Planctomycetaceae bacterium]MBT6484488.1 hypothetical protein [Planctomycetaceae bacterium]MBT6498134.1 hypothetical protein [Planctomycetaceae bacterium]
MFRLIGLCCLSVCMLSGQPIAAADNAPVTLIGGIFSKPKVEVGDNVVVVATDGRVTTGLLVKDGKESITLKLKDGGTKEIPRKKIEEISKAKTSFVRKDDDPNDPRERFLVLTPGGPVVVEARIMLDGKPFRLEREKLVAELLRSADTDGDGKPTWQEGVANPRFGSGRFSYHVGDKKQLAAIIKRHDLNRNGTMEVDEARHLLVGFGGGIDFNVSYERTTFPLPNVQEILDGDGDDVISQDELSSAAEKLKSRDANDNDLIELTEVDGGRDQFRTPNVQPNLRRAARGIAAGLLGPTTNLVRIHWILQLRYGGDDKLIQPEDFRWLPKLVTQLDLDGSGTLDAGELIGLHLVKPHLIVEVNLGDDKKRPNGIRLVSISDSLINQDRVSDEFNERVIIERPGMNLNLTLAAPKPAARRTANDIRYAQEMLTRCDTNKNGSIEEEEIKKAAGQNEQHLVGWFYLWDANEDGRVYPKEIVAFFVRGRALPLSGVVAHSSIRGPSFFKALDETGDNRISLREMKLAAKRLAAFDKNGDGKLDTNEMPVEIAVTFGRGSQFYKRGQQKGRGIRRLGTATAAPKGPDWFVRMDKNGDGDLTLREFLGGKEKFKQLDANSDGFIERKEAEAVESKSRR